MIKKLWVEEYRPKSLETYIFQDDAQKAKIEQMLSSESIPHLLLCGIQGSGKTALAQILINELNIHELDLITVNASDKTGIDFLRETIVSFAESLPVGSMKIVHLEEMDAMSHASQAMLRVLLEETSHTCRFIATCNYENKILPAIKSRMQVLKFKAPNEDEIFIRTVEILEQEKIQFEPEVLDLYIRQAYPDIRKIINNLQLNSINGQLISPKESGSEADYKFQILDLIAKSDFTAIYKLILTSVSSEDIEPLYEFIWSNLNLIPACSSKQLYESCVLIIADTLRVHAVSAFPHITFQAMCIKLIMAIGE